MRELFAVSDVARELRLDPSRVRALIASGGLRADKIGGRWLVDSDSVEARRREPSAPGRPMAPRNAWALLLEASDEPVPEDVDPVARWRRRQALQNHGLVALRARLERRARVHRLWALPGELRALRADEGIVLSGSSAAGALKLGLAAPDAVDAYVPADRLDAIAREYGLEDAAASQANVILRAVPHDAWVLDERRIAPRAAVALDLASYADPRSARVGLRLLKRLEREDSHDRPLRHER